MFTVRRFAYQEKCTRGGGKGQIIGATHATIEVTLIGPNFFG